jgi:hypothetical protein
LQLAKQKVRNIFSQSYTISKGVTMWGKILGAIIIIAIVAAVAFLILNNSTSSQQLSQLPSFNKTNATVPSQFSNVTSQPSAQTTAQLATLSQTQAANTTQFSIYYNGSLHVVPAGLIGSFAKVNSPLYVYELKYGNDEKMDINITSLPLVGSGVIVYANLTNGTYTCTNLNVSAASGGNYEKLLFGKRSISCVNSSILAGINFTQVASFNFSQLQVMGLQLSYQTIYQSTYKGIPCTYMSGLISEQASSSGAGAFNMCISDKYYFPLSFSMYFSGKSVSVAANINETSVDNVSQQSTVDSLPGPIV